MLLKKSLGQNWLMSKKVVADIIAAAYLSSFDTVLEVGPGKGVLTEELLKAVGKPPHPSEHRRSCYLFSKKTKNNSSSETNTRYCGCGGKVIAVEKDGRLVALLQSKFSDDIESGKLELIHDDILKFKDLKIEKFKVVANIPYYITGQLIKKFLTAKHQPNTVVLMLQKEVAERIVARGGKESLLSISVKAYGEPRVVRAVSKKFFSPEPKVDSAIVAIEEISRNFFNGERGTMRNRRGSNTEKKFFELLRTGFAGKRKQLGGKLKKIGITKENLDSCSILPTARAENLSPEEWRCLGEKI